MKTETYRGSVSRVFFANPDSPFMAGVLTLDDGTEVRFGGKCFAGVGDQLEIVGSWGKHPKFGPQLEVESGIVRMDESPDGLVHLLATHEAFEGLGPARARKVVDAALALSSDGNAASALVHYPEEIAARANVPLEIVQNAAKVWGERKGYFDALARLAEQGWGSAQSARIVSKLGENAAAIVRQDPYMLIGKIARFGFKTVDVIARKLGVASTDPARVQAGVAYCLDKIAEDGNTWTTREGLQQQASDELRPDTLDGEDKIREAIDALIQQGMIHVDTSPTGKTIVADARLAQIEINIFQRLVAGMSDRSVEPLSLDGPRAREIVPTLNSGQLAALRGFSASRMAVISGGAGVGKTFVMRAICEVAEENGLAVALCAPTGKAARRLAHATEREAKTVHKMLCPRFDPETGEFAFMCNKNSPIEADLVIVDEVSMVDVRLMRSLLNALSPHCRLLLVGDHHQIPSVGPGAILRDILSARSLYPNSVHVLTEIVRQAGILARNTTALLDGLVVTQESPPWGIHRTEKGSESGAAAFVATIVESLVTAPKPLAPFDRSLDPAWDIQVLAPMKKGPIGTYVLNVHLQKLRQRLLGNPAPEVTPEGKPPKPLVGDRIIWVKNDYELDLLNGTQAIVLAFPKGGAMLIHTEDGREVTVPAAKRNLVEVAYAITIHKCVAGDTLIETENGWQRIDSIENDGIVGTAGGSMESHNGLIRIEDGDLLYIETEGGYSVTVTPDHKLRVFDEELGEWTDERADSISVGSFLRMRLGSVNLPIPAPELPRVPDSDVRAREIHTPCILTDGVAEFLGLMVADGTRYAAGVRLAKRHVDVVERFAHLGENIFGLVPKRGKTRGTPFVEFNSTVFSTWLHAVGGMEPNAKAIPQCILAAPRSMRAAFLRGLFEDGTVNIKGGSIDHIEWSNVDPELVRRIQTLLLEFGIISSINLRKRTPSLYIYSDGIRLFRDMIGFVSEWKNQRLRNGKISRNSRMRVPVDRDAFSCSTSVGQNARYSGYVSRATAEDLGMHAELAFHYPRVTKIEQRSGPSFCLTVPSVGAFLQNRFDGLNSQGSQWPCVILVCSSSHWIMHDRNLIYTGASRAAESLTIVGDMVGIKHFAATRKSASRQTFGGFVVHGWEPCATHVPDREQFDAYVNSIFEDPTAAVEQ